MARVGHVEPAPHTVLGWVVTDIEASVPALAANGVVFQHVEGVPQDALGICAFGAAKVAWFQDPDGNTLSLTQMG